MVIFKCIVTLTCGEHRVKRFNRNMVEKLAYAFRCKQRDPWLNERNASTFNQLSSTPQSVKELLFINEYTGERLQLS